MSILTVEGLTKSFGSRTLIREASFHIEEKDRVGLVGANGTGKTTLFNLLTGKELHDGGVIAKAKELKIGTMEQHVPEHQVQTAREWVLSCFEELLQLEETMEQVQALLESGSQDGALLEQQHILRERYEREGGLYFRSRVDAALTGLGFSPEQKELPLSALSGGQRSKLGLARLLVSGAQLLLLDEPTNHLDLTAILWLEEFLRGYDGAFIVISHDRYFLDRVTQRTMELEHQRIRVFDGGYTDYLSFKKEQRKAEEHRYAQQMKEIHRLENVVTEMRRWNREKSIKRAESKQKVIDKLTDELEKPESEEATIRFAFHARHTGPNDVLTVRDASLSFGERALYQKGELLLKRGERAFLIGPNGCGKTTFFKQLLGQLQGEGTVTFGPGVSVGYYDQTGASLHDGKTVLDEVWDDFTHLDQTTIRNGLAAFLFRGEDVFKTVGDLSGGERARISLLKTMLGGHNLLLLDEPTNHLDIGSREALEDALSGYDGTLLMISHDRYFINKLADRVLLLTPDGLQTFQGDYDAFLKAMEQPQPVTAKKTEPGAGGLDYKERKAKESRLRKLRTSVGRLEETLAVLETRAEALKQEIQQPEVSADYKRVMELTGELEQVQQQMEEVTDRWAEESMLLESLESQ